MKYREVRFEDLDQIFEMYRERLNFEMSKSCYDYFYNVYGVYCSRVLDVSGRIVAHNALIPRSYEIDGFEKKIRLSSGGMASPDFQGAFFMLLKQEFSEFSTEGIIAFPNRSSLPFFRDIFGFNVIEHNYFSVSSRDFRPVATKGIPQRLRRPESYLTPRLSNNPMHQYKVISDGRNQLHYKTYKESVDIVYVENYDASFPSILQKLFNLGFEKANIIHWNETFLETFGFKRSQNNSFVWKRIGIQPFECQMIDSDVF